MKIRNSKPEIRDKFKSKNSGRRRCNQNSEYLAQRRKACPEQQRRRGRKEIKLPDLDPSHSLGMTGLARHLASLQVTRHLRATLYDLASAVPLERQKALRHYIEHLDSAVKDSIKDTEDQTTALAPRSARIGFFPRFIARLLLHPSLHDDLRFANSYGAGQCIYAAPRC
jgi:hypothetical protein